MKQIFNDLPKIIPQLYLSSSIIKKCHGGFTAIFLFNAFHFVSSSEVTYAQ